MSKVSIKINDNHFILKANICHVEFHEDFLRINFGGSYDTVINGGRPNANSTKVEINELKRIERELRDYLDGTIA